MAYVGIDYHKRNTYVTKMDKEGNILSQENLRNEKGVLEEFVNSLSEDDEVVLEATGAWYYFYELLEGKVSSITLSHPAKTRIIAEAKIKTDKIDSEKLAHLLRANLVPASYIPSREIRDLRELLRFRASLVSLRTSLKNKVHSILSKEGLSSPYSDIFSKKSLEFLSSLSLRSPYRRSLESYLRLALALASEIKRVEKEIEEKAKERKEACLLMTMPGISYYSSLLILAEIGDINRFYSAEKLCSYAGLVPSVYSSGGKTRKGKITKCGSTYLRWILIENSMHAIRGSYRFESLYRRVCAKGGKNKAKVAVARKMLSCIYFMLKKGKPFKDIKPRKKRTGAGKLGGVIT